MLAFRLELYPVYPPACTSFAHLGFTDLADQSSCGGLFVFNGDEGGLLCGHVKRPLFCGLASGQSWIPRPCFLYVPILGLTMDSCSCLRDRGDRRAIFRASLAWSYVCSHLLGVLVTDGKYVVFVVDTGPGGMEACRLAGLEISPAFTSPPTV